MKPRGGGRVAQQAAADAAAHARRLFEWHTANIEFASSCKVGGGAMPLRPALLLIDCMDGCLKEAAVRVARLGRVAVRGRGCVVCSGLAEAQPGQGSAALGQACGGRVALVAPHVVYCMCECMPRHPSPCLHLILRICAASAG